MFINLHHTWPCTCNADLPLTRVQNLLETNLFQGPEDSKQEFWKREFWKHALAWDHDLQRLPLRSSCPGSTSAAWTPFLGQTITDHQNLGPNFWRPRYTYDYSAFFNHAADRENSWVFLPAHVDEMNQLSRNLKHQLGRTTLIILRLGIQQLGWKHSKFSRV